MKNVLFVVSDLLRAGAQTQAVNLVNSLDPSKFNRSMVCLSDVQELLSELNTDAVTYISLVRRFKLDASVCWRLARIMDEQNIDIVHCTEQFPMAIVWFASKLSRCKPNIVTTLHLTANVASKQERLDKFLYVPLLRSNDKIIFVCKAQRDFWFSKHTGLEPISAVIHNGVDTDDFSPSGDSAKTTSARQALSITENDFVFLCLAGFRPEKGHDLLLKAFATTPEHCVLLLAGSGELLDQTKALAETLGVAHRVHFLGLVSDVRELLDLANASVLASTAVETFSIAMLESMAMQTPVISSMIGGMAEAIEHDENGFLFPVGDVESLSKAMLKIQDSPENAEAMGKLARQKVLENFTTDRMTSTTESLLLECGGQD